jgi:hypothetical protein
MNCILLAACAMPNDYSRRATMRGCNDCEPTARPEELIRPHFLSPRVGGRGRGRGTRSAGSRVAGALVCSRTVSIGFEVPGCSCSFGCSSFSIGTVSKGLEAAGSSSSSGCTLSGMGVNGGLRAAQPTIERTTIMPPMADNHAAVRLSLSLLTIAGIIRGHRGYLLPMCVENSLNW